MNNRLIHDNLLARARHKAKQRGFSFDLTRAEFMKIVARSHGKCEITGIAFDVAQHPEYTTRPFAPSLDRIDSSKGYSFDNCRLVCTAVNLALNEWGYKTLETIALRIVERLLKNKAYTNMEQYHFSKYEK